MSLVSNENQQLRLDDLLSNLTEREQRMLRKSWAEGFSSIVFPVINDYAPKAEIFEEREQWE